MKATKANTKDYSKTLALQKRLINMGAKIKADGIMGAGTRAAMKKFMNKKTSASPIMSMKTSNIKKVTSRDGSKISIAERLKSYEKRTDFKDTKWTDLIYSKIDEYMISGNEEKLKSIWKNLGKKIKERENG
mgnify:CR=1 FL=1